MALLFDPEGGVQGICVGGLRCAEGGVGQGDAGWLCSEWGGEGG